MSTIESIARAARPTIAHSLLSARAAIREMGHEQALDAIVRSSDPMPDCVSVTYWNDGTFSTRGGNEEEPGEGELWRGSLEQYVEWLDQYAPTIHPKGAGRVLTHGRSRFGGSADMECIERSWIFGDSDGMGDPDAVEWALRQAGIAFVIQRRNADRFHLEIPLSEPLIPTEDDPLGWKSTRYVPELGWLLGVLSEIGELACRLDAPGISKLGFDAATSRLLQLRYPVCRRERADAVPVTIWNDGNALSWNRLLLSTGYKAGIYAGQRAYAPGESDESWLRALSRDGFVVKALRGGKYALSCPWSGGHSTGKPGDTSTVLFADGTWHCSHGSCASRSNTDVFEVLSDESQRIIIDGLEESARRNPNAAFAPYILDYAVRRDGAVIIANALRRAGVDVGLWARVAQKRARLTGSAA